MPRFPPTAIYWAAHQRRREVHLGLSSLMAMHGNKIAPWFADWYPARTGYDSQQTNEPVDTNRPNNLYEPVPGDHGAHGSFDDQSRESSPQLWANKHRGALLTAVGAGKCDARGIGQAMRYAVIARAAYGALLLVTPGASIQMASGEPASRLSIAIARILGLRHLAQGSYWISGRLAVGSSSERPSTPRTP